MTKVIEYVSIILENEEGKLWISRRNNPDKIMYGKYQCPGGHIEDESRLNAVVRELHEETNLIPNDTLKMEFEYAFNVQNDIYDNGLRKVYVYSMTTDQIPINCEPNKHDDWILLELNDLALLPVIESLDKYLSRQKLKLRTLFIKVLNIPHIFEEIAITSISAIMKLRLVNKRFDRFIMNWIKPYKISTFIWKIKSEVDVMSIITERRYKEHRTHSVIQQLTLQKKGRPFEVIRENLIIKNNIRLRYPDYFDNYNLKGLLYHNYSRGNHTGQTVTCKKEGVIKWHNENFIENRKLNELVIPINFFLN